MNDKGTQPRTGFPYLNAAAVMSYHVFSTPFVLSFVVCFAVHVVFFVCVVLVFGNEKQPLLAPVARTLDGEFCTQAVEGMRPVLPEISVRLRSEPGGKRAFALVFYCAILCCWLVSNLPVVV